MDGCISTNGFRPGKADVEFSCEFHLGQVWESVFFGGREPREVWGVWIRELGSFWGEGLDLGLGLIDHRFEGCS